MPLFLWHPQLATGVPHLDDLRRGLLAAMNQLHGYAEQECHPSRIAVAFAELTVAVARYCAAEELYLEATHDLDRHRHAYVHARLQRQLSGHYAAYLAGDGSLDSQVFGFLLHWVRTHLGTVDTWRAEPTVAARPTSDLQR